MMKGLLYSILVMLLVASCSKEQLNDCFTSTGIPANEKRDIPDFDSLIIGRNIDVVLISDTLNFVQIQGGTNLLEGLKTTVENRKLTLENTNRCHWVRKSGNPITVAVHCKTLQRVVHYGSGNLSTASTFTGDSLIVEYRDAAGISVLNFNLNLLQIIQHSGTCEVQLKGETDILQVYLSDLCSYNSLELSARDVFVDQRSAADCYVSGSETLRLYTWSDGSIYFTGTGTVTGKQSQGQGTISRIY